MLTILIAHAVFVINARSSYRQNISDEKFMQLFEGLEMNTHLESLSLTNVGLTDKTAQRLAEALEKNSTLRVLKLVYQLLILLSSETDETSLHIETLIF